MDSLQQEYNIKRPSYESLREETLFIINRALTNLDIKINKIEYRVKTFESFAEKVERKEIKSPFDEIKDLLGIRIVCLFLSDIPKIREIIDTEFIILEEENKIDGSSVESFGYMSHHFIVKLKDHYAGPRYDNVKGICFEIQVRTMAMDAWANISHYLDYKSENDIPTDLKRDFYALSGLFYVADKHFEMFFRSRQENSDHILEKFEQNLSHSKEELNIDSLKAYMKVRFPDRVHNKNSSNISELVDQLYKSGYNFIDQIEEKISLGWEAFLQYEKDHPPGSEKTKDRRYQDVGIVRILLNIVDENFGANSEYFDLYKDIYVEYRKLIKAS